MFHTGRNEFVFLFICCVVFCSVILKSKMTEDIFVLSAVENVLVVRNKLIGPLVYSILDGRGVKKCKTSF